MTERKIRTVAELLGQAKTFIDIHELINLQENRMVKNSPTYQEELKRHAQMLGEKWVSVAGVEQLQKQLKELWKLRPISRHFYVNEVFQWADFANAYDEWIERLSKVFGGAFSIGQKGSGKGEIDSPSRRLLRTCCAKKGENKP